MINVTFSSCSPCSTYLNKIYSIFFVFSIIIAAIKYASLASSSPKRRLVRKVLRSRTPVRSKTEAISDSQVAEDRSDQEVSASETSLSYDRSKRSHDKWLEIISKFGQQSNTVGASLPWQPFPIDLPIGGGEGQRPVSLPVLILPIPVPVPGSDGQCSSSLSEQFGQRQDFQNQRQDFQNQRQDFQNDFKKTPQVVDVDVIAEPINEPARVDVDYLIREFRAQQPRGPHLPPAVVGDPPEIEPPRILRQYLPPVDDTPPTSLHFNRSMTIRGFLTIPLSDYTEAYMIWYDGDTGAYRVDYHDDGTSSFRVIRPDGQVQRFVKHVNRTGDEDVRVCGVTAPYPPTSRDINPPGLPDVRQFRFEGYMEEFGGRVEVWRRTVKGNTGSLGAAPGESLEYHHDLLVHRDNKGYAIPLKYTVSIDSSVLGKNFDGYEHTYSIVKLHESSPSKFIFNPDKECDVTETLSPNNPEHAARLDPLREFTLSSRDARYEIAFSQYTSKFEREYVNEKEQALRKALVIKNLRRVNSCNRQSLTFDTEMNFLGDRLDVEVQRLFGVDNDLRPKEQTIEADTDSMKNLTSKLMESKVDDDSFDWRDLGGVTRVRNQGSCSCCYAIAVVGSVEGAYFKKTGKLVELSEQSIIDCGHKFGTKGCEGSWPTDAFNYVKSVGLPAQADYTPFQAKVLQCRDNEVQPVTRISGFMRVPSNNIDALKMAIKNYAPAVVVVDKDRLMSIFMKGGVYRDRRSDLTKPVKLNHAVLAVGFGREKRTGDSIFYLKNSYGAGRGIEGYMTVHGPSNSAHFLYRPIVAIL